MKRKIAAVLMADVAGPGPAVAVVRGVVARGGGRMLNPAGEVLVAEFQSAVEAVRAAVDVQETLRVFNKTLPPEQRVDFKLGITIGEVIDGGADVPAETLADAARMVALATPKSVCVTRSVREAVLSKLKLRTLDVTVEGVLPDELPTVVERLPPAQKKPFAWLPANILAGARLPWAVAGLACGVAALVFAMPGRAPDPQQQQIPPQLTTLAPTPDAKAKPTPAAGTLEFKPAHAPDPALVLTARRMLPQAWRDCHTGSADTAVTACKLLLDSGIPKGDELADIHVANGKALRDRHELGKALAAFSASLAAAPTPAAYSQRGTVHYDQGNWDKAIADYSEAIRIEPANGESFNNRAWTYYRAGRSAEALADANMAVKLLAREAYVWDTRAHIHAILGNRDAAISDFRAALAIDPSNAASKAGLASLGVN